MTTHYNIVQIKNGFAGEYARHLAVELLSLRRDFERHGAALFAVVVALSALAGWFLSPDQRSSAWSIRVLASLSGRELAFGVLLYVSIWLLLIVAFINLAALLGAPSLIVVTGGRKWAPKWINRLDHPALKLCSEPEWVASLQRQIARDMAMKAALDMFTYFWAMTLVMVAFFGLLNLFQM